jgi:hypothetical protein
LVPEKWQLMCKIMYGERGEGRREKQEEESAERGEKIEGKEERGEGRGGIAPSSHLLFARCIQ